MRSTLSSLVLGIAILVPQVAFANHVELDDPQFGQHPYEARYQDLQLRQELRRVYRARGHSLAESTLYYHPSYAKTSVLHPFFRKGGISVGGDSYAEWRGYSDPVLFHEMSPDTYCLNFRFARQMYRAMPYGFECYE